jgi:xanthine dehydrogenase YagT iron-sulfur-binding subunit
MAIDEKEHESKTSLGRLTRRSFLSHVGAATAATAIAPLAASTVTAETALSQETAATIPGTIPVSLRVNGQTHAIQIDPRATLLDTLRETLHLTGTKKGCDHGQCGACTIHVNGRRVNSCLAFAVMQQNPIQEAFVEHDGFQCGYCTSGQIMSAVAMVKEPWGPTDMDVREAMSGNICRCGAYPNIVSAVQACRRTV